MKDLILTIILILYLTLTMYVIFEITLGLFLCKFRYKIKKCLMYARFAYRTQHFILNLSLGIVASAIIVMFTSESFNVAVVAFVCFIVAFRSAIRTNFMLNKKKS